VQDRLEQRAYFPLFIDASLALFSFQTVVPEETVLFVFLKNIIEDELRLLEQGGSRLLNEDFRDIGICFFPAQLDNIVGFPVNGYVDALLFTADLTNAPRIAGRVYQDQNGNGIWDYGEGLNNVTVKVFGSEGVNIAPILTEEGIYSFVGQPGLYFIEVWLGDRFLYQGDGFFLEDQNVRKDVVIMEFDMDETF
jgi:hypothetical protein